jgi:hypothetical protein
VRASLLAVDRLAPSTEDALYALFRRQFVDVPFTVFRDDLRAKQWALVLRDDAGAPVGFTSWRYDAFAHEGRAHDVVYSGDTVVDPAVWSQSAMSALWLASIWSQREAMGVSRLHWFLIASGYRTYRFLPLYARRFFPCFDTETPHEAKSLMAALARARFGDAFDPGAGVVRLPHAAVQADGLRGVPDNRLSDPHIAFFASANPGHEHGDELVCLTELTDDNLTSAGRRMLARGRARFADVDAEP